MGGVATDFGSFMKVLMNDQELLNLMLIPVSDQSPTKMIDKYFVEAVTSGVVTTEAICRVLITANPQLQTNNMYIKRDALAIEVFVPNLSPNNLDRRNISGFERRSNKIVDRIIQLYNNKLINGRRLRLEARHELASNTAGFARMFLQFSYKRVYS